jgi:hypothetical protein
MLYNRSLTSGVNTNEHIRMVEEIYLQPQYKVSNMLGEWGESVMQEVSQHPDKYKMIIPQTNQEGVYTGFKFLKPTAQNMAKNPDAFVINRSLSADFSAMMNQKSLMKNRYYRSMYEYMIKPLKSGLLQTPGFAVRNAMDMFATKTEFKNLTEAIKQGKTFDELDSSLQDISMSMKMKPAQDALQNAYFRGISEEGLAESLSEIRFEEFIGLMKLKTSGELTEELMDVYLKNRPEKIKVLVKDTFLNNEYISNVAKNQAGNIELAHLRQRVHSIPTSTSDIKGLAYDDFLEEDLARKSSVVEEVKVDMRNPILKAIQYSTIDNPISTKIMDFNNHIETTLRESNLLKQFRDMGSMDSAEAVIADQNLKAAMMQFSDRPGGTNLTSIVMPFFQFPLKQLSY